MEFICLLYLQMLLTVFHRVSVKIFSDKILDLDKKGDIRLTFMLHFYFQLVLFSLAPRMLAQ